MPGEFDGSDSAEWANWVAPDHEPADMDRPVTVMPHILDGDGPVTVSPDEAVEIMLRKDALDRETPQ